MTWTCTWMNTVSQLVKRELEHTQASTRHQGWEWPSFLHLIVQRYVYSQTSYLARAVLPQKKLQGAQRSTLRNPGKSEALMRVSWVLYARLPSFCSATASIVSYSSQLLRDGPLFFFGGGGIKNPEKTIVCKSKKAQINCLRTWKGWNKKFADQLIASYLI